MQSASQEDPLERVAARGTVVVTLGCELLISVNIVCRTCIGSLLLFATCFECSHLTRKGADTALPDAEKPDFQESCVVVPFLFWPFRILKRNSHDRHPCYAHSQYIFIFSVLSIISMSQIDLKCSTLDMKRYPVHLAQTWTNFQHLATVSSNALALKDSTSSSQRGHLPYA